MIVEDWGLIDYQTALEKQSAYVDLVAKDLSHTGFLIYCSHPEVVTRGRQTKDDDILDWQGPVVEVSRGGRATYHGPSQLVVYAILNIKNARAGRGPQEVRGFIRSFEECIINTLKHYGITALGKTDLSSMLPLEDTGVWIGQQKIASIGIAVRKWVTFHGAAINLENDPKAFLGLKPCGYEPSVMTNLEIQLGRKVVTKDFKKILTDQCLELL